MTTKCEICAFFGLEMKIFSWFRREISQLPSTPFKRFQNSFKNFHRPEIEDSWESSDDDLWKGLKKASFVCVSLRNLKARAVHIFVAARIIIIIIIKPDESKKSKERFNGMKSAMRDSVKQICWFRMMRVWKCLRGLEALKGKAAEFCGWYNKPSAVCTFCE